MSGKPDASSFPIKQVKDIARWFTIDSRCCGEGVRVCVRVRSLASIANSNRSFEVPVPGGPENDMFEVARFIYNRRVGHIACFRCDDYTDEESVTPIEFMYAFYVHLPPGEAVHSDSARLATLRFLFDDKVGHIGSFWFAPDGAYYSKFAFTHLVMPIELKYANIKWSDLFAFYTAADGVLRLPKWKHLKHALDEFLAENPRFKYHPSRVQQFINENGVENLEAME